MRSSEMILVWYRSKTPQQRKPKPTNTPIRSLILRRISGFEVDPTTKQSDLSSKKWGPIGGGLVPFQNRRIQAIML